MGLKQHGFGSVGIGDYLNQTIGSVVGSVPGG